MNKLYSLLTTGVALVAAHYLPHAAAGIAAFGGAALLLTLAAARSRRRARAREYAQAYPDTHTPAPAREVARGRAYGRAGRWVQVAVAACAGLGALVWALGVWVLWATAAAGLLVIFVLTYLRSTRRRVAEVSVTGLSTPPDSGSWLAELPGRVADAVDAARLVRGHADAGGVQADDTGEGAA